MDPLNEILTKQTRRTFLERGTLGLGAMALGSLLNARNVATEHRNRIGGLQGLPHFAPKVKRVIYLFQSGGPAQMDLFDYKPHLAARYGEEVPESIYPAERKTTMTAGQKSFPCAPSTLNFARHGQSGTWVSEPQQHVAKLVDDLCVIKSMHTEAINHDPAATLFQTGSVIPGRPSLGAWVSYGLGSENANLPAFVAMTSNGRAKAGQPLYDRLWSAGFLPGRFQGVKFRGQGDPILDLYNPAGVTRTQRRRMLDALNQLNREQAGRFNDPAIATRIAQYELAFRMQMSVPELIDVKSEPQHIREMYGPDVATPGRYAYNCLLAGALPSVAYGSFSSITAAGMPTATRPNRSACNVATPISPPPHSCAILSNAACSTILSLSGAENSAVPFTAKASSPRLPMAATIIPTASPTGSPAVACAGVSPTARPTITASTLPRTQFTSTTCRLPSSINSASTTNASPIAIKPPLPPHRRLR